MSDRPGDKPKSIEQLREAYARLEAARQRAQTELARAEERLKVGREDAKARFGSDELEELQQKLQAWTAENETRRTKYQAELEAIETELKNIQAAAEAAR